MKKLNVFLIAFLGFSVAKAQHDFRFADTTAIWKLCEIFYEIPEGSIIGERTYNVRGDTMVNGISYQIIDPGHIESPTSSFVRSDSVGRVYFLNIDINNGSAFEYLVLDFSLEKGDSVRIDQFSCTVQMIVDSVDTIAEYNGEKKRLFLRCDTMFNSICNPCLENKYDIWVSGVGSLNSYFIRPYYYETQPEGSAYQLLKYEEREEEYEIFSSCGVVGIQNYTNNQIRVYPNPFSQTVTVDIIDGSFADLAITIGDVIGNKLFFGKLMDNNKRLIINSESWQKGVYFISFVDTEGKKSVQRIVKCN